MKETDKAIKEDEIAKIDAEIQNLLNKIEEIENDPSSASSSKELCAYTPKALKRINKYRADITYLISKKRELEGLPVPCNGYSGRQTNRR